MPIDDRSRAQIGLILDSHPGAAAHPAPDQWDDVDSVDYLYREYAILAREQDAEDVATALRSILADLGYGDVPEGAEREIQRELVMRGIVRLIVPATLSVVPDLVARLDDALGPGAATPDHLLYLCPATQPEEVSADRPPDPAVSTAPGDGDGILLAVLDSGLLPDAEQQHYWMEGVRGAPENPYSGDPSQILPHAGHGTFMAGLVRTMAPSAAVRVEPALFDAGAVYESELVSVLFDILGRDPQVILLPFGTYSHRDQPLLGFEVMWERVRNIADFVLVAAAGDDASQRRFWPAAFRWTVSVGALSANQRSRASFSNHGTGRVDVFAPGERLVNAYATGRYVSTVPPNIGEERNFRGMARWSGTAFAAALVAGLIAAHMSKTGVNGRTAADSLLQTARARAIPGVGPVLLPSTQVIEPTPEKSDSAGSRLNPTTPSSTTRIFLVHGHARAELHETVRVLERMTGLEVIVLREQPNAGRTILEKFEDSAAVTSYAVVLLTADDIGRASSANELQPRGRQNVIFELGFFFGRLGRDRVTVLQGEGVEQPSDIGGLVYTTLDSSGAWKLALARELESANISVNYSRIP